MPNERTDNAIPYISGQGKPRGFKQTKPPLISQGLVILYFSILFDVLTKQDDTGELALKFDFLFFPALFLAFFLSLQPVSVRPFQCVRRSDWSCPPSLFILIAYLSFPLSLFLSFSPCMTFCSLRKNAFFIKSVSVFLRFVRCVSDVSSLEPYFWMPFPSHSHAEDELDGGFEHQAQMSWIRSCVQYARSPSCPLSVVGYIKIQHFRVK